MPVLKVKARGLFEARINKRIDAWAKFKILAARIQVPVELIWWAYNEYGTAAKSEGGGSSYSIDPVTGHYLAFPGPGGTTLTTHVNHPGVKPSRSVTKALDEIREELRSKLLAGFADGAVDDPERLRAVLMEAAEAAKLSIVASMAQNMPGTRPANPEYPKQSGRLEGKTAASVFKDLSTVVDTSE